MQANPYQSPVADLALPADGGFDQSGPFSPKGRFGRLSYLAWSMVLGIVAWVLMFALVGGALLSGDPGAGMGMGFGAMLLVQLLLAVPAVLFGIRRLHDFGSSGWWMLLMIVPIANLVLALMLLFRAGDAEANRFAPPRETRGWEKVLGYIAIGFGVLAIIGIIAAIAIPMLAS